MKHARMNTLISVIAAAIGSRLLHSGASLGRGAVCLPVADHAHHDSTIRQARDGIAFGVRWFSGVGIGMVFLAD